MKVNDLIKSISQPTLHPIPTVQPRYWKHAFTEEQLSFFSRDDDFIIVSCTPAINSWDRRAEVP